MTRARRFRFLRDVLRFTFSGRRAWLAPILLVLLVVSVLAALGALTPYAAFIYPL
jgi:hypothetical protein